MHFSDWAKWLTLATQKVKYRKIFTQPKSYQDPISTNKLGMVVQSQLYRGEIGWIIMVQKHV
jgi:transcription elongation factor GreA-like protein